ncbi:hypothetical protein NC796_08760 [Aliifodinibius sp. S!AR15-10]|uniref:choice-of-anchor V domain-containing protein n=1 Tax=Aliifodinibius sp. S!AR15-10 TaxID=2950437 RepID=UPI00285B99B6|nr:choice-of-anchor V domain-containing protein [Aliifodinibius sp. S!AR15-10]MDR8391226.1 hypothetical protein [Aliifodinibius sp. S!AR15-10]
MIKLILPTVLTLLVGLGFEVGSSVSGSVPNKYPEHLTGAFTGGFGEDTCHSCHFDYPLNHDEGKLSVDGFPQEYKSGQSYMIRIHIERPGLAKAGFQLTARFADGWQAGMFSPQSDRTQFTSNTPDSIQYLQHSAKGTELTGNESTYWQFKWIAPQRQDEVQIHLAANAANGDASEFSDFILTKELQLSAAKQ